VNALALVVEMIQTRLETSRHFKKKIGGGRGEQNISKTKAGSKK